jgi:hypothetical protein
MPPAKQKKYKKNFRHISESNAYMWTAEDLPEIGRSGEWSRARLYRSRDGGDHWDEVPLRLNWRSRLVARICTSWPPESIDDVRVIDQVLSITFHDRESEWERSPLPFRLGEESLWEASYDSDKACWNLRRLRRLDFDGQDRHLRSEKPYYYE